MLHPTIEAALAPFTPPQADEEMSKYIHALQAHDWTFEYSEDQQVWARGRASLAALQSMRATLDPSGRVWNQHAPSDFRVKQ